MSQCPTEANKEKMFLQFNLGEMFRCFRGSDKKICISEYRIAGNYCMVQNFAFLWTGR